MVDLYNTYVKTDKQRQLLDLVGTLADRFSNRAAEIDEEGEFPFANFDDLKDHHCVSLTVPAEYGGAGLNLYDFLMVQERLAQGDGATALSMGWHLGTVLELAENRTWNESTFKLLCKEIVESKALINRAATEHSTGSPTRGGLPETTARHQNGKWFLNGRKSFTSMAVALNYSLVLAKINDSSELGFFLVNHKLDGVSVEEKWNTISMRGTRSDDLILTNVMVNETDLVERKLTRDTFPKAWLLHIPACYLGIAGAARNYAIQFAKQYKPNSLPGPIKNVPEVQRKIGEMELELFKARQLLYSVASRWVDEPDKRMDMGSELAAVKHIVTNSANTIVDIAMRIVGAKSLFKDNPMQRYYRDVRAGLHNPPMDDMVISLLAKRALEN